MSHLYRFGWFVLDSKKRTLTCKESLVSLTSKTFDVLAFFVQNPNRVVTKKELLDTVWAGSFVEEGVLTQYIFQLRKVLTNVSEDNRWIVTIPGKGYQFTADVAIDEGGEGTSRADSKVPDLGVSSTGVPVETEPGHERSRIEAVAVRELPRIAAAAPKPRSPFRAALALTAVAVVLAVAGYIAWRHLRPAPPQAGPPPGPEKIMLAVLPFQNLTSDPKEEYLADGLTEELISQLGRLHPEQLGVIARTSVMGYKHSDTRLDQIGRELSVQYVLEGSVRRSADRFRVTVQLVQVKGQSHLWSQDYDYRPQDILSLEDDAAMAVAREIQLRLTPQQQASLTTLRPVIPDAFDAYLQGRYFSEHPFPKENLDKATHYLEQAVKLDHSYALAWASLAEAWRLQVIWGYIPNEDGYRQAREAVERALALDPNLAEAHAQIGWIKLTKDWDWVGAEASFQRALALDPGNSTVVSEASYMAAYLGRFDEALKLARRAVELDPRNALSRRSLAEICYWAGRQEEAVGDFKRALDLDPNLPQTHWILGLLYLMQGHAPEALAEMEKDPMVPARLKGQAIVYYAMDLRIESDSALAELIAKYQEGRFSTAEAYAFRGETDRAFDWLEQAYAHDDERLAEIKVDPLLRNLHGDPRYAALLKKLHVPQ
jgi:TolB-like protein/DNA-binding winged helix-turn-helix (wHTH) protein/Tfp pilus assembly protein PilF